MENNLEIEERKTEDEKSHAAILDMLECPVCLEYPRQRPIYTCNNAHVTCSKCITKIKGSCPICRNDEINPNPFVGRMADKALQGILVPCQFACHGCKLRQQIHAMEHHEVHCQYREVHCPAKHRGACHWLGSLLKMVGHVKERGCIQVNLFITVSISTFYFLRIIIFQIIRTNDPSNLFKSFIGDFSDPNTTVFNRNQVTHWKPVMMVSEAVVKYLIYMTIQRKAGGLWYIQFRSFSSSSVIPRFTVKLQVYKSEATKDEQKFSYEGAVISSNVSDKEMLEEGKYLLLTDAQLKLLKTESTIFEYDVEVIVKRRVSKPISKDDQDGKSKLLTQTNEVM